MFTHVSNYKMANILATHIFVKLVYIHIYILKKLYEWHVMCCYGYIETLLVLIITNEISAIILYIIHDKTTN